MMTPEQCRGARAMLDWSQTELGKKAGLSLSTVRDFEKGRRVPHPQNMQTLVEVMEAAGITFTVPDEDSVGVTLLLMRPQI